MKKNKNKLVLFLFLALVFIFCNSFIRLETDLLYYYQWGLNNNGNCRIMKNILRDNYVYDLFDYYKDITYFSPSNYNYMYDPEYLKAECNNDIQFEDAYELYLKYNKSEAVVAMIDTGIDINHYEIKDNIWTNKKEIPNNGIDDDNNGYIDDIYGYNFADNNNDINIDNIIEAHGTHASGIIVSKHDNTGIKGIAYDKEHSIKIMPIKILNQDGIGNTAELKNAIEYAVNNGANVCNISLGAFKEDRGLYDLIKKYSDVLFVVASGNGENFVGYDIDMNPVYPASYSLDNLITVGNLAFDGLKYTSSNYGQTVDIFVPGTYILSTLPDNKFGFYTGTSMAAPFVTAVASMIMSIDKNLTVKQVKNIILNSATYDKRLSTFCNTSGRLNAFNALNELKSVSLS